MQKEEKILNLLGNAFYCENISKDVLIDNIYRILKGEKDGNR